VANALIAVVSSTPKVQAMFGRSLCNAIQRPSWLM